MRKYSPILIYEEIKRPSASNFSWKEMKLKGTGASHGGSGL